MTLVVQPPPIGPQGPARTPFFYMWSEVTGTAAVESALTNFSFGTKGGANVTAATSIAVAAGKTHRITAATFYIKQTSTVLNTGILTVRAAATVANTSPVIYRILLSPAVSAVVAGTQTIIAVTFPDGAFEMPGATQWTMTWLSSAATCQLGAAFTGFEY